MRNFFLFLSLSLHYLLNIYLNKLKLNYIYN